MCRCPVALTVLKLPNRFSSSRVPLSTRIIFFPSMQKPRLRAGGGISRIPQGSSLKTFGASSIPNFLTFGAHLSILPPRCLQDTESAALQVLERICSAEEPFEVTLGDVETFIPVTPTVLHPRRGRAARMIELHSKLNTEALAFKEEWPYIPHLTIVKMTAELPAQTGLSSWPASAGPVTRRPSYLGGKSDVCPRRCPESLGRSGARPSRPHSGFPVIGRNLAFSYSPAVTPVARVWP